MKIKGYISRIDLNLDTLDVYEINGKLHQIPGITTTAKAEIVFTEGFFDDLLKIMNVGEPIEIDLGENNRYLDKEAKEKKKSEWRMIRFD